jgi:hypothetical protein
MPIAKHRIGRMPRTGPAVRSFDIEWDEANKVPRIINENGLNGPNSAERTHIQEYFLSPVTMLSGGEDNKGRNYDTQVTLQPGTLEHFSAAVYQIPNPFQRIPS